MIRFGLIALYRLETKRIRWAVETSGDVRGSTPVYPEPFRWFAHAHLVNAEFQECACKRGTVKSGSLHGADRIGLASEATLHGWRRPNPRQSTSIRG